MTGPVARAYPVTPLQAIDAVSNADQEQALYEVRKKIYPRAVHGVFARWRVALVVLTQLVYYGLPWLTWNDRQAVLFDLGARKFYIFGLVFWPQDLIFLTALLVISALSLFLFTAVAGRLWCGYACPQTVYTEMFMWIERKIEGDRTRRMQLDKAPWSARKLALKGAKQAAWIAIAAWTGFTFVGYFAPIDTLAHKLVTMSLNPWEAFWILFYGGTTYGNAGYLREQVCKYMCPYARFQSVMFDSDTLIVTYDPLRGEPRGPRSRKIDYRAAGLGDCVDCTICVQVCPVGIDIRKGLQYECIGCAACIDGCDQVMDKMGYPRGLIRYSTENALTGKASEQTTAFGKVVAQLLRPRIVIYTAILASVTVGFVASLYLRVPLKVSVQRDRGTLVRDAGDGRIENVYRLQITNAVERPRSFAISATGLPDLEVVLDPTDARQAIEVAATSTRTLPLRLRAEPRSVPAGSHDIRFHVTADDDPDVVTHEKSVFFSR
jgi:cytochrome c oxidase accessory protein FixG